MEKNIIKRKKKKKKRAKRIVLSIVSILILISIGIVSYGYNILKSFSQDTIAPVKVSVKEPVNILVLGVDAGDLESKSKNTPRRSDTMLLVHYNPESNNAYMLSIPRDTRVNINGHAGKINTAHAIGGPELAIKTVEKMLSIDINYYLKLDYEGFRQCIDAIGGIDIVVPRDMNYDASDIKIHFKKGDKVHLDGKKAEEFVRWRKNNDGVGYAMGDLGRQETQQEFLIKVIEKMKTPSGIIRLPALMKTISKYVKTNISPTDLMKYSFKLKSVDTGSIHKQTLEGEAKYISGVSYYIWNRDLKDGFLENFRKNKSVSAKKRNEDSHEFKVTILNATGVSGLAAEYAEKLRGMGYEDVETGNYTQKMRTTKIEDYTLKGYGSSLKENLGFGSVFEVNEGNKDKGIVIILGADSVK